MSEQDMADIAVFLAGPERAHRSRRTTCRPTARPKASEVCLACHGTNGVGITADYPTISGQHSDYIERALHDYQKGGRKNAVMAGMAATLTPQDIEAARGVLLEAEAGARDRPEEELLLLVRTNYCGRGYFAASCFSRKVTMVFW